MNRNQLLIMSIILCTAIFFFILTMLGISYMSISHGQPASGMVALFITYHIHLMILLGALGISLGILSFYSFTLQERSVKRSHQNSKSILFRFIDRNERVIIEYLIRNKDKKVTQAHISQLENMGKVKAHRTILKLEEKNILSTTPLGKTKILQLHSDIADSLQD